MANVESGKKAAAIAAIDCHVLPLLTERTPEPLFFQPAETERSQSRVVLGIGSGSTVVYAVRHLAAKLQGTAEPNSPRSDGSGRSDSWRPFVCVPTSFQAKQLILSHRLPLGTLEEFPVVDVTVDGADEVDLDLNCVKGGGGCQVLEKLVAFNSRQLIIIADDRKQSDLLFTKWKKGIPIEILPQAYESFSKLMKNLTASLPIQLTPNLRMAVLKAGPVVTDNGNFIIDLVPSAPLAPNIISELEKVLERIPGVVGTGLFIKMANAAYFGKEDGSVVNLFAQGPVRNPFAPIKLELEQCLSAEQK